MEIQTALDQEIKLVCPINGISFGKLDDKKTWRIDYAKEATEEQKAEANKVLENFVWDEKKEEAMRIKARDDEYWQDLSCRYCYAEYKEKNPDVTFSAFMDYLEKIERA